MSWHDTVHCGYCYTRGHNRIGCPARKRDVAAARAKNENDQGWRDRGLITQDERYKSRKKGPRYCSYCRSRHSESESGHNRRKCHRMSSDQLAFTLFNKMWRHRLLDSLRLHGIGIGAMIKVRSTRRWTGDTNALTGLVTSIHWDNLCFLSGFQENRGLPLLTFVSPGGRKLQCSIPVIVANDVFPSGKWHRPTWEVLSPAPNAGIENFVPQSWLLGETPLFKEFFLKKMDSDSWDVMNFFKRFSPPYDVEKMEEELKSL